ncbi:MAG: hypothetical protein Q8N89_02285 [Azonexus sp.]|nr:hypothetical protein [Azonexus sp.]
MQTALFRQAIRHIVVLYLTTDESVALSATQGGGEAVVTFNLWTDQRKADPVPASPSIAGCKQRQSRQEKQ